MIKIDPNSLQMRMQRFVIAFKRHKIILKKASKNFKNRYFFTLNLVMNLVMVLHAHFQDQNDTFDIFIQIA